MSKILFASILTVGWALTSMAQPDSAFTVNARHHAIAEYHRYFANQSRLYNGTGYNEPLQTNDTHPFYRTNDWQKATLLYDALVFDGVDVLIDLSADMLVIEYLNGNKVSLISQKLKEFTVDGARFINIAPRSPLNSLPEAGFYQVLYDGPMQCLARRKKNVQRTLEEGMVQLYYKEKASYFVLKDGVYHPVRSKRSLLDLLASKAELHQYMRKEKISFRRDREAAFVKILAYYQELKK